MKITDVCVEEGNLYEFVGEGAPLASFDCYVVATGMDGTRYVLNHTFSGKGYDAADGFYYVAPSRANAQKVADKVAAKGEIDLSLWYELPAALDLEERLAMESYLEQLERRGLDVGNWA